MVSQNIEFRADIKFLTKEWTKSKEIHRRMADVYGESNIIQWQSGQQNLNVGEMAPKAKWPW